MYQYAFYHWWMKCWCNPDQRQEKDLVVSVASIVDVCVLWNWCSRIFSNQDSPFLSKLFTERRAWYCSGMTTNVVTIHEYRLDICWLLQYYICHDSFWMRYITSPYWWTRTETVTAAAGIHQVLVSWIALSLPDNDHPPPTGSDAVRSGPPFLGRYRMAPFSFKTKYHISWFFWFGWSDLKWLDRMTLFW